jgi:hypothetical protein
MVPVPELDMYYYVSNVTFKYMVLSASDGYPYRIDAIIHRKYKKNRRKQETGEQNCRSLFHGRFMCQFRISAKLCVRKTVIDSSFQAQCPGDFICQKWRSYGISDTSLQAPAASTPARGDRGRANTMSAKTIPRDSSQAVGNAFPIFGNILPGKTLLANESSVV